MRDAMSVLIYGGGAVGLGIASCIIKSGAEVDIITRPDTARALREGGLERVGIFGAFSADPASFRCYSTIGDLTETRYDYILVCTKAHNSMEAARDLSSNPSFLEGETKIVLFQNGWGGAEIFSSFFPKERVFNARVITGFVRPEKNRVEVTVHADAIHVGSLFSGEADDLADLCASIAGGGIPCEVTQEIGRDLWAKMLYNCALNALGAIFEVPYGVLGEWEYTRDIMETIVMEVYQVMGRCGHTSHWESPGDYLAVFYEKLLPPTAKHDSSMLQDIRAKKETEIDFLNGAIVNLGKQVNSPTPVNLTVYNMMKFMETSAISGK
jgi:2-dehydropantoate 2-reductase